MTENDYGLRLYNGDTGVVVARRRRRHRRLRRRGEILELQPAPPGAVDTVYAMTIHKSQGSQFDTAAVLLPPPTSRILTRELLYTAVTRGRKRLIVAGSEERCARLSRGQSHARRDWPPAVGRVNLTAMSCRRRDSNPRHADYDSAALTD